VIGTAVEGTEDLVVPGQTGWLVPPGDIPALSLALIDAADSAERRRHYGAQGRSRVDAEFSLDRTVASYEHLWAGILGLRLPTSKYALSAPDNLEGA
jgi:starch synthase (maltosyl-transferring)